MSARSDNAIALLRILRGRLTSPDEHGLIDTVIGLIGPSKGALRQRKLDAGRRVARGSPPENLTQTRVRSDADSDAEMPSDRRQNSPHAPLPDQDLSIKSQSSAEEIEKRERDSTAIERAGSDADLTLEQQVLARHPTWRVHNVADVAAQLIAKAGFPRWDATVDLEHLMWIAQKPRAEFAAVLAHIQVEEWCLEHRARVTPKHLRGKWSVYSMPPKAPAAHRTMSEPVELDEQTRKRRDLTAKLRDERALLACASEAAKPRLQENVERLQRELEQLTTRAA